MHLRQPDREQHGPHDDLEHLIGRRRFEEALRDDVLEHARERDRLAGRRDRAGRGRRQRRADAGLDDVDREQPDEKCEGSDDFEVNDRLEREPAHALHVFAVPGDPHDQRAEDQRHDDRLDDPDEGGRNRKERDAERGPRESDRDAADHGDDDPLGKGRPAEKRPHRAA